MLTCNSCGAENDLGRVFCTGCGAKLDLSQMSSGEITDMGKQARVLSYWPIAIGVVVLIVLTLAGLALWPQTAVLGEQGARSDAGVVKGQISFMKRMKAGASLGPSIREKSLNAYFQNYVARDLGLSSLSASLLAGKMKVRLVRVYGPFGSGAIQKTIPVSIDLDCAVEANNLVVKSGAIGHLPLPGPLSSVPKGIVVGLLDGKDDWKQLECVKEIVIEEGNIRLQASR